MASLTNSATHSKMNKEGKERNPSSTCLMRQAQPWLTRREKKKKTIANCTHEHRFKNSKQNVTKSNP